MFMPYSFTIATNVENKFREMQPNSNFKISVVMFEIPKTIL